MRRLGRPFAFILNTTAVIALSCSLSAVVGQRPVLAQSPREREAARADLEARQRALRSLENLKRRAPRRATEQRLSYQQIKEDFEQLQLVNYRLSGSGAPLLTLDYDQIRKDAGEVRKRASRLKTNLILPEPDKDEKPEKSREELTREDLKPAIATLDALVKSFVWNPVFQHPNVLDLENSARARRDLDAIIRLSEQIQKRAEALSKVTEASHN